MHPNFVNPVLYPSGIDSDAIMISLLGCWLGLAGTNCPDLV